MTPEEKPTSHSSSSGLEFLLHPLVLINISDHHTRTKVNATDQSSPPPRVMGCMLGQQSGRTVDISNSFEVGTFRDDPSQLDFAFLQKKLDQYKQVFPQLDVVGWYATGDSIGLQDMELHRRIMGLNESPVLLLLDTTPAPASDDLPVTLFESEIHVIEGATSFIFVKSTYSVATSEAERIGVDQVAKLLPSGRAAGADQLSSHVSSIQAAAKVLVSRVEVILEVTQRMLTGEIAFDPEIARQAAAIAARLPAADAGGDFAGASNVEACDALLSVLLSGLTSGAAKVGTLTDKHNAAYERIGPSAKRGGKGGPGPAGLLGSLQMMI